ncbi:alpha-L-fucosidase [Tunicatimonas pelagia]|uniref:alpha-L-fucosidase n=1 Tax=Tunicatimonas pelagia TaxID=931531 RepID=UPI00266673AD|nr:alpha-L-fucosidase [Tunicatimonas pelagia]WKN45459.1 alpha-L-fucosidase [Tunicatimonas pelagia]
MKQNIIKITFLLAVMCSFQVHGQDSVSGRASTQWWQEAKLGFFIHWGAYAVGGAGEQVMMREQIPVDEYQQWVDDFVPNQGCMDSLVRFAKEIGMKYVVLTTRHHDGFCLFNTQTTDFNSVKSTAGRDFVKEFVEACRKYDMRIGLYYSIGNWRNEGSWESDLEESAYTKMADEAHNQVRELMTNYGKVDILWFDGAWFVAKRGYTTKDGKNKTFWRSEELQSMVRNLQPDILINNRGGGMPGDFITPEGHIGPNAEGLPWESCMTLGYTPGWGYMRNNATLRNANLMIYQMMDAIRLGGNFLLNVGPNEKGEIPPPEKTILQEIGQYVNNNQEAIYKTELNENFYDISNGYTQGMNFHYGPWTFKENVGYLHVFRWGGKHVMLSNITSGINAASLLASDKPLEVNKTTNNRHEITGISPDQKVPFVIEVVFEEKPGTYGYKAHGAKWLEGELNLEK